MGQGEESGVAAGPGSRRWRQVAAALRAELGRGAIAAGLRLPPETALAERFGVSRFTIRRALAELHQDGLVRIEHGRGIFAADDLLPYRIGERTRFTELLREASLSPGRRVVGEAIVAADAEAAIALAVPPGTDLTAVEAVGEAEGRIISVGWTMLPRARFDGIGALVARTGSWTEALKAFGVADYRRRSTEVIGRLPSRRDSDRLRIPRTQPVLEVRKLDVTPSGEPVCYGIAVFAAHRVKLRIDGH